MEKHVYLQTYGCQMNERDSEEILGMLTAQGYRVVQREDEADVILLNTCSVRAHAEERAFGKMGVMQQLKRRRPDLVLGILGCMAKAQREEIFRRLPLVDLVAGPDRAVHGQEAGGRGVERLARGQRRQERPLPPLGDPGQELRQVVDLGRPRHEIDLRQPPEDLLTLGLRHAPENAQHEVGLLPLERLHEPHLAERPFLSVRPHRAGVEQDHVGLFFPLDEAVPLRRQHPEDLLGIPLVHLATVRLEVNVH